ncbi:MAG: lysophospholipid acyltransferase family protein [Rubrimonas sp.]|uniref:lysophospholipid acyltransferase family protein n=1 Tax=Rubrimonas sp. TaxID=2036015 RepID=UPI002FDE2991
MRPGPTLAPRRSLKALRSDPLARGALARLGAGYVALCWRTTRWRIEGRAHLDDLLARGGPIIPAFWHGRLIFSPLWAPPGRRIFAMISNNRDGDLIAEVVGRFGVETVRGSTADPRKEEKDKGGRAAFVGGLQALREGGVLAITPDGPRGPRMRAQSGAAGLSVAAGAPILPIAWSARHARMLGSWDRFLLPIPFDRGLMIYGAPLEPPPRAAGEAGVEAHRLRLEAALNALTAQADAAMDRPPVEAEPAR